PSNSSSPKPRLDCWWRRHHCCSVVDPLISGRHLGDCPPPLLLPSSDQRSVLAEDRLAAADAAAAAAVQLTNGRRPSNHCHYRLAFGLMVFAETRPRPVPPT